MFSQLRTDAFETLNNLFDRIGEGTMDFLLALIVLFLGWMFLIFLNYFLEKILRISKVDKLSDKINQSDLFKKTSFKVNVSSIILNFIKAVLILIFLIIAADIMQWDIISVEISNLLRYLPKLFSALVLFMIGLYIAEFVRKGVYGLFHSLDMNGAKMVSNFVFYGIVILVTITALNQAGVDTRIITDNVIILFASFLLTFALAFGLGSRAVVQSLLLTFYTRKNLAVGDIIKFKGLEGEILAIDNISLTIKTLTGRMIIPIKDIVENTVEVKD